ncbi:MAG: NUDIX hydrolase [Verrucomicrobiales bacterium]
MMDPNESAATQAGVIPFLREGGKLKVVIITNRRGDRWLVPKGDKEKDLSTQESAMNEAFEEAGLIGVPHPHPSGHYVRRPKSKKPVEVEMYPFQVEHLLSEWPERRYRKRRIVGYRRAAQVVRPKSLGKLIFETCQQLEEEERQVGP